MLLLGHWPALAGADARLFELRPVAGIDGSSLMGHRVGSCAFSPITLVDSAIPIISVLQGCEEGLRNGVVVAISGAVAGKPRVVGARPFGERPVAVEHDVSWHVTVRFGRFRRHYDDVAGHAIRERAFDHHVGAQVDGGGQVEPALSGAQVGDVAHELVDGRGAREVAAQQVGARLRLFPGEKAVTFFRNAFSISSSRMCF